MARTIAQRLGDRLGQQVIVENKTGASWIIAADIVAKAPADGYTLLFGVPGPIVILPALGTKLPYDPIKDLAGRGKTAQFFGNDDSMMPAAFCSGDRRYAWIR
jgi:tripartite-type tricarboxylate transporter receptor subunit TctC